MTKEKILEYIREVCNLKRLEFGCEVVTNFTFKCEPAILNPDGIPLKDGKKKRRIVSIKKRECSNKIGYEIGYIFDDGACVYKYSKTGNEYGSEIEIIGLPVELNHLLDAIQKEQGDVCEYAIDFTGKMLRLSYRGMYGIIGSDYDLTKSVSENLDNQELLKLVTELLLENRKS